MPSQRQPGRASIYIMRKSPLSWCLVAALAAIWAFAPMYAAEAGLGAPHGEKLMASGFHGHGTACSQPQDPQWVMCDDGNGRGCAPSQNCRVMCGAPGTLPETQAVISP